ncbi:MAG: helix-turn-helix domain-containing protein [Nocardiopsaceae bacterium]|nr:helix-turn-helix domain-containing protein [Nocardiopsaceae bacterium]
MYRERTSPQVFGAVVWYGTSPGESRTQRVLPDGCMDLIWIGGTLLVAGPDTTAHLAEWVPGRDYVGLRFAPGTAPAVLGVPAHELRDQRVPLADMWPAARVRRLTDQLAHTADAGAVLEEVAVRRLGENPPGDAPVLSAIVDRLRAGSAVAATAQATGLSERQLHRRCLAAFGYGPKTLARILRMNRALGMVRAGVPIASAAAAAGYADQPHLTREVKILAGAPITELTA